jgi:hypothetical protein
MSNLKTATGDRLMEEVAGELGMSECGKNWALAALDPFHDTPIDPFAGYPDNNEAPSVQQVVKSSYSISAGSIGGNFDAHVCWLPWLDLDVGRFFQAQIYNGGQFTPLTVGAPTGSMWAGLMVDVVPSGTNTMAQGTTTPVSLDGATMATYTVNDWRLVAVGFEVINTTSELNAQGLVTAYRCPVPQRSSKATVNAYNYTTTGGGGLLNGSGTAVVVSSPPTNVSAALLLPGSVQWKAKEGAYIVPTLNSTNITSGLDDTCVIINDSVGESTYRGVTSNGAITGVSGLGSIINWYPSGVGLVDFNIAGAYFTGLSNSTTLTVNIIHYFERFPSIDLTSDLNLVVLAKPSCRYDPKALELYSAVIRHMPVGVPQRFNGLGDWFREAVETAKDIISPVLSAIPHPIAMMGSGILNGIAGNINKKYSKEEEKSVIAPGRIYQAQGNQSVMLAPKKSTVAKQLAQLQLVKKKKKKKVATVAVVQMVKKKK